MDIEKKTLIYILIGLLYLSTTIVVQDGWKNSPSVNYLLFGEYDKDSYPDLVVDDLSEGAAYGDLHNFVYSGHYIGETLALGKKNKLHEGLFVLRLSNDNFLEKRYNRIPPNSSIRITAYNDIFGPNLNQSHHCESLNMTVKQNNIVLETLDVESTGRLERFNVELDPSKSRSKITLNIAPNRKCGDMSQLLGVDKFYLERTPAS